MRYLPEELANEMREKYFFLKNRKTHELEGQCRKLAYKRIIKNAQIQSYEIENPHSKIPFSVSRNNKKKTIREGIKNIESAFAWGVSNFDPLNFDESFVRELAGKIYPSLHYNTIAQYRRDNVRILGASKIPPDSYKIILREIPWFVESLKQQLSDNEFINRINAAIFAHLHLARIHPFEDGNGRTARTFQDVILTHYQIPTPLISSGERHVYYSCLDKAVIDWNEKKASGFNNGASEGESLFYTFIAGKINNSLDQLASKCKD
jgi:Fic family protein